MTDDRYIKFVESKLQDNESLDDIYAIADFAVSTIESRFNIIMENDMILAVFIATFEEFINALKRKSAQHPKYKIIFAKRMEIGYDNTLNEDYEKNGGFIAYVKHLYYQGSTHDSIDYRTSSIELCAEWTTTNINVDKDIIKEIASATVDRLRSSEIKIQMNSKTDMAKLIMPLFATFYDCMVATLKIKHAEAHTFEYSIPDFATLFSIRAQSSDDGDGMIIIVPTPSNKREIKDDASASSKFD